MSKRDLDLRKRARAPQCPQRLDNWENEGGSIRRMLPLGAHGASAGIARSDPGFALLDAMPLGILITNTNGEITYCNRASQDLYGTSEKGLLGVRWRQAIDTRDLTRIPAGKQSEPDQGAPSTFDARVITGEGKRAWTRQSIVPLVSNEAIGAHMHVIEDISAIKAAEKNRLKTLQALSRERERARVTLECIGDAVISTDAEGRVTYLNPVAEQLTGWSRDQANHQPLSRVFRVISTDSGLPIKNPAVQAMETLEVVKMPANSLLLRPDGSELGIEDSAAPILDESGKLTGAVLVFRDRMLSRESTTRMAYLARHDALTGLPNRVAFAERFDQAIRLAQRHDKRVGLLFIDVDDFKAVNDRLGHGVGDRLLRNVSKSLVACVRSTDMVCRYGGDEFAVLLSEINAPEDAGRVALKIRAAVSRPRWIQGRSLDIGLSIGISLYPDDGSCMDLLINRADTAMYEAKLDATGEHRFYHPGMQSRSHDGANVIQRTDAPTRSRR